MCDHENKPEDAAARPANYRPVETWMTTGESNCGNRCFAVRRWEGSRRWWQCGCLAGFPWDAVPSPGFLFVGTTAGTSAAPRRWAVHERDNLRQMSTIGR